MRFRTACHQSLSTATTGRRFALAAILCTSFLAGAGARRPDGQLELTVVDAESGEAVPTRIHLRDGRQRAVRSKPWGAAPLGDHAYVEGPTMLELRRGPYRFDLDAGPEYRTRAGHFTIERHADDAERVEMRRFANLAGEGWLAADLQSARSTADLPLLLRATQTSLAARVGAVWRDGSWRPVDRRAADAGRDSLWIDPRGVVWLIDPSGELRRDDLPATSDSSGAMLREARRAGWRILASATSLELPLWLANGLVDGLLVIDGWAEGKDGRKAERVGRVGDPLLFAGRRGAGRWREHVYHQALEAGLRVAPVAGSGSGLTETPFSDARVYVAASDAAGWWDGLEAGAAVVTNGPLLRPTIDGSPPGVTFYVEENEPLELEIGLNLATRHTVDYLEILKNGEVAHSVRLAEWAAANGRLPKVAFGASGWLAIRAVTDDQERYRLATTAPYWVESSGGPRVSRAAVAFFAAWLEQAAERFEQEAVEDYAAARRFWAAKRRATTD